MKGLSKGYVSKLVVVREKGRTHINELSYINSDTKKTLEIIIISLRIQWRDKEQVRQQGRI